jgi:hypothetical protein
MMAIVAFSQDLQLLLHGLLAPVKVNRSQSRDVVAS